MDKEEKLIKDKRWRNNLILFTIIFAIMGGVKGVVGDVFRSYIRLSNKTISHEMSMLIGFAMIFLVIALILVKKFGHKKIFIAITVLMGLSLIGVIYFKNPFMLAISSIILNLGDKAYDVMMALVIMAYTTRENRIITFTRAIVLNVLVGIVVKMFDGKLAVLLFSEKIGVSYSKANSLTTYVGKFSKNYLAMYSDSMKVVLFIAVLLIIIATVLLFFMREKKEDYAVVKGGEIKSTYKKMIQNFDVSLLKDKYLVSWVIYSSLMGIESNFITPNLAIYFNRMLHISRGGTSTILAMQSLGMLVFLLLTPWTMKRMGNIKFFAILIFLSGPVMIIMGMGNAFLPVTGIVMGGAIFLRYGFTHAVHPVQDSIQLLVVNKENRPIFVAIITAINAVISIIVGFVGAKTLFSTVKGYEMLFYFFGAVFMFCGILLYVVFKEKYDKALD